LFATVVALAALLLSNTAAASSTALAPNVTRTREVPSAEYHVYVIALRVPHVRAQARRLGAPGARSAASTTGRAVPPSKGGRHHGVLQTAGDFSAGVSSALTFGLSDKLIGATGLGKYGSKCSGSFAAGKYATMAATLVSAGVGALGKAAVVEGAEVAEQTVSLYRAVSPAEFADIFATGGFRAAPGAFAAKQFGLTLQETLAFADKFSDVAAIVRAEIPQSTLRALELSTQIDSFIFKSGVVTAQPGGPLALLNQTIIALEHVF
jgi:hypothetical protein